MGNEVKDANDQSDDSRESPKRLKTEGIKDKKGQDSYKVAFQDAHLDDATPSGLHKAYSEPFGIDMGDGNVVSSRANEVSPPAVAWEPIDRLKHFTEKSAQAVRDGAEHSFFPFRGREDTQIDYSACAHAFRSFPEFSRHANIDRALIPAIIRNELHFYNLKEKPVEGMINVFGTLPKDTLSIGPAQIQKRNIDRLISNFPQLSDEKQGAIKGNPLEAALSPSKAPWFVAALLAERIQQLESTNQPITHNDLIQYYNPGGKPHFENVHKQLLWIKNHHSGW